MERSSRGGRSGFQRPRRNQLSPPSSSSNWRSIQKDPTATAKDSSSPCSSTRQWASDSTEDARQSTDDPPLVGTCPDMCPAKERAQRERLRDLAVFEILNGNPGKTSPSLAVKKFCRTISTYDVQTSDLRPLPVLKDTLLYLLGLVDSSEHPFEVVHDFVFDRTRSIRQDISMQRISNDKAIYMYEEMVKFHILSYQKLARCCGKSDISSLHYLNIEQLMKCMLSLFNMYDNSQRSNSRSKNEAEFYSFYVLLQLGCKLSTMGDSLSLWFRQLPFHILHSKEMQFVRTILRCLRMGNYKRFFATTAAEASCIQLCLMEPLLNEVRAQAITYLNYSGYKLHPYPLTHLSEILMIKESELESLCNDCGLNIITDESGCKLLPAKQTNFSLPKSGFRIFGLLKPEKFQSAQFGSGNAINSHFSAQDPDSSWSIAEVNPDGSSRSRTRCIRQVLSPPTIH